MSTSLQVAGLASNFDWKSFLDQIMEVEHAPADRLAAEKATNTQKVTLLGNLGTKLTSLQTAVQALKSTDLFGTRNATSSTTNSTWSASAATDAPAGSYKIAVTKLATNASIKGTADVGAALNPASDDVSGLTLANLPLNQAVTAGTFTINGKQVTVALTDSLQDVFTKISTATGGDVTASYDHTADKITLTSASGTVMLGAANDTTNFLRALKLGNNGTGTVTSAGALGSLKTSATLASANLATAITAVDGTGAGTFSINGVAISYNVNTDSIASVMAQINASSAGVSASYDAVNDRFVLANKSTGDLGISVSESAGGLLGSLGLTSGTTFTRGTNAEFTINDGPPLTSASNTLDATSHGIAGLSVTVNSEDTQTITVAPNTTAMRSKIDAFVKAFNDVQDFIDTNTKITTDSKGKVTAATLSRNREIQSWADSLRSMAFGDVSGLTGTVTRLNHLGLDFTAGTSDLAVVDDAKLTQALSSSTGDVEKFFTQATTGFGAQLDTFITNITAQNSDQQTRLNKDNTDLDDQIAAIERRLDQQRSVMESAFIQMEDAQSKLKTQQTALSNLTAKS